MESESGQMVSEMLLISEGDIIKHFKSLRPRSIWIPWQLLLLSLWSRELELDPDLYDPEGDAVLLLISWQEFSQVIIFLNLNWNSTRVKFLVKLVLENKQQLGVCISSY